MSNPKWSCRSALRFASLCAVVAIAPFTAVMVAQLPTSAEHEAIAYSTSTPHDAVAALQKKIDAGEAHLQFDPAHGYLPSVLKNLKVPTSSQGLVFSRTSLQVDRIAPWTPRAIYFNDDTYVGWVQNGPIMEVATVDPQLGAVFYTLDQQQTDHPVFHRQAQTCLQCHDSSSSTGGVPGFIMRSVFTDRYGYPVSAGAGATTDRTPIDERWGGWYVTGTTGDQEHMGNLMAPQLAHEIAGSVDAVIAKARRTPHENVTDLSSRFDTDPYLTPHSDAVALLVLTHQTYVHNLITNANYETRKALYDERLAGQGRDGAHSEMTMVRIKGAGERLVKALLFAREAPFGAPITGTSGFAADFASRGPRDGQGRSLRDLDLKSRVFRYPVSYLIYSDGFDALPEITKEYVYRRLREVLSGDDQSPEFASLSTLDRRAALEILTDTKPDFSHSITADRY